MIRNQHVCKCENSVCCMAQYGCGLDVLLKDPSSVHLVARASPLQKMGSGLANVLTDVCSNVLLVALQ